MIRANSVVRKLIPAFLLLLLLCVVGCGTFVTVKEDPALPGAKSLKSVGVALFSTELKGNRYVLMNVGGAEESSIVGNIQGWATIMKVVASSPDPLSKYALTKEGISKMAQNAWIQVLSGQHEYKVGLVQGMLGLHQFSSSSPEGEKAAAIKDVSALTQQVGLSEKPQTIIQLASDAGVDAILAGKVSAVGDILRSTGDRAGGDDSGFSENTIFRKNQFVLDSEMSYEWVLYDGKTGKLIGSNDSLKDYYAPIKQPGSGAQVLNVTPGNKSELTKYLNSNEYVMLLSAQSTTEAEQYAYAILSHFHGYFK